MANTLKVGCVGTSSIMEVIVDSLHRTDGLEPVMIYSRNLEKGAQFAKKVNVPEACDDYNAMIANPDIDIVYIASPNYIHAAQAIAAMNAGKHVIVEKPACPTEGEVVQMYEAAIKNNVYFFEATTTLWMPNYLKMKELLPQLGALKEATIAQGQYSSKYDAYLRGENPNIMNPAMKAGALNDMGIYCIHAAVDIWGEPESIEYIAEYGPNGIDIDGTLNLRYPNLLVKVLSAKNRTPDGGNGCRIIGENGSFRQSGLVHEFKDCVLEVNGQTTPVDEQDAPNRMIYEHSFFRDCILNHDSEAFEKFAAQSRICSKILETAHADDAVGRA